MGDKVEKTKHNVTVDDIPGDGMARSAGDAIKKRQERRERMMEGLFGSKDKDKKKKKKSKD